jgi:outer membrane murein-binding lipoprotein Lpp
MQKIIILGIILATLFLVGCANNQIVGSVVNTQQVKHTRLNNCLQSCENDLANDVTECKDVCYAEIADSFNDKTLCRNIVDKQLRTDCLIY